MNANNASRDMRVGWVLCGDISLASSRLQGYRIHEQLLARNVDSEICATNANNIETPYCMAFWRLLRRIVNSPYRLVVFQKPNWAMYKMSELLRAIGLQTAAIQCDVLSAGYEKHFDHVFVTTEVLLKRLQVSKASIIDDMLEVPRNLAKKDYGTVGEKLRIVWVGQGARRATQRFLFELANHQLLKGRVETITIGPGEWADRPWALETVHEDILSADVAVIYFKDIDQARYKSSNRLTQFMALGMPTVVSPIDAYAKIYEESEACVIAGSLEEFAEAIFGFLDANLRQVIGEKARQYAWDRFAPELVGNRWLEELGRLLESGSAQEVQGVSLRRWAARFLCGVARART